MSQKVCRTLDEKPFSKWYPKNHVTVIAMAGRNVLSKVIYGSSGQRHFSLDISSLPPGLYTTNVITIGAAEMGRFLKQ